MPGYSVTTRVGPRVDRQRFHDLDAALVEVESRGRELAAGADATPIEPALMRRFEPV